MATGPPSRHQAMHHGDAEPSGAVERRSLHDGIGKRVGRKETQNIASLLGAPRHYRARQVVARSAHHHYPTDHRRHHKASV